MLVALAAVLPLTSPLPSELDVSHVPAETTWLVHVDLQAFRTTHLWEVFQRELRNGAMDEGDWDELREFEQKFGFRVFHDVDGVTVSGRGEPGDDAVVMVETSANLDAAMAHLQQQPEYRSLRRDGIDLHGWAEHGDVQGAFYVHEDGNRRLIVVSEEREQLENAIAVVRGQARSLSQNPDARLFPRPTPGAFLFIDATAALAHLAEFDPASAVAEMAQGARIEVGESRGEFFLRVEIEANTYENAQNIYSVINGAKALAALAGAQEDVPRFAMDLINSVEMNVNGTLVTLQFRYDAQDLVEEIRELEEWDH